MPRTRTTPEPTKTIYYDTIELVVLQIAYDSNMQISLPATTMGYGVMNRSASGEEISTTREVIAWNEIPESVKTAWKEIFTKSLLDATNKGLIGAGTDGNDLP